LWAGLSVAAIALAAVGCSHFTIQLNQDAYQPQQLEQLLDYRDRAISFDYDTGVQNDANDTSIFYYWNKEHTVYYEGAPTVAVYFFNTITKALRSAGLRVYDAAPPAEASQLHIVLKSVTDQRLAFQVKLVKQGRETLNKTYTVDVEPTADMNADVLRKRAYETIDKMVLTFLNDDAFKKAFFAKD
jgi:hypothetical protein